MEHVYWKKRALWVARILGGLALIAAGFFYVNRAIDKYAVPFFIDNFSDGVLKEQVRSEKKGFSLFFNFKPKKKTKQPKEVEVIEVAIQREVSLSVGIKACIGIMLLFISFLIMFLYLGIESIVIGWMLLCQAGYEAFMWYDLGVYMRYKDTIFYGSLIAAALILIVFLWEYMRTHKAYMARHHKP